jgi:hypothetical protein
MICTASELDKRSVSPSRNTKDSRELLPLYATWVFLLDVLSAKMPIIEKPHFTLKVEQPKSAFAEGNARW